MKRLSNLMRVLMLAFVFLGCALSTYAQINGEQIDFSIGEIDPTPMGPGHSKTPVLMPTVWQDGYFLDFHGTHDDYVLRIVDATNTVVYSMAVPSYQTQLWLPTYLVGTYRIELLTDDWLFYGAITL